MTMVEKFSTSIDFEGCHPMDKALAIQVGEAILLQDILVDDKGVCTLFRVQCQEKTTDERINDLFRLVEPIWQALKKPGAFSTRGAEVKKWKTDLKNAMITSVFTVMGTVGINEIEVKGNYIILVVSFTV